MKNMDNNKLIKQIGNVIEKKLEPIKKQLDTVELKVEAVNNKVDKVHEELQRSIEQSQEETIEVLSDLIHTGYDLHEKRIKKIENNLGIATPHQ